MYSTSIGTCILGDCECMHPSSTHHRHKMSQMEPICTCRYVHVGNDGNLVDLQRLHPSRCLQNRGNMKIKQAPTATIRVVYQMFGHNMFERPYISATRNQSIEGESDCIVRTGITGSGAMMTSDSRLPATLPLCTPALTGKPAARDVSSRFFSNVKIYRT